LAERDFKVPALEPWLTAVCESSQRVEPQGYAKIYPENCVLLVDTYNVLKSGIPAAIKVFHEMKPKKMGIRIDSGDVTYLTKKARVMLDKAGLQDCTIVVSNSLDEYIIRDVIGQGAKRDTIGVCRASEHYKTRARVRRSHKLAAHERTAS
jgi:nicotinate phosphoribosyltransferase